MPSDNPFESYENPFSDPYIPSTGASSDPYGNSNIRNNDINETNFLNTCQHIKEQINQYKSDSNQLQQLQQQQINAVSESAKQQALHEIDNVTLGMKSLQLDIKNNIESAKLIINRSDPDMVNQINNLNRLFRSALQNVIIDEDRFKENITHQAVEQYQIINPEASYNQAQEFVLQNGTDDVFQTSLEMQNRKAEAMEVYQNVKYRHDELVKIQEMAATLNQMFNDLQDIVLEQDEYLTNANQNIDMAQQELEKGDGNVIQATNLSKKNRKCKWIILCLCILLVLIIVGIIVGLVKGLSGH